MTGRCTGGQHHPPIEGGHCPCGVVSRHPVAVLLNEHTTFEGATGAATLRNRCAFTPRDMGADWPEAFAYAVVMGWDDAMDEMAARWGWDEATVEFLHDAHCRFAALPDRAAALTAAPNHGTDPM